MNRILADKKAVIFDLDGTLVDSMWMWEAIDIEYLGRFGIPCPPDLGRIVEGMSFSETALYFKSRFALSDSPEEIKAEWTKMSIDKYRTQVPLKKGAEQFLNYLSSQKIPMGIATSNGREIVDAVLEALKIGRFFSNITTGCEVAMGKPAPDIYLQVAKRLQADPKACLVFEDVPAGIQAGKSAGMTVVAVDDRSSKNLRQEKEDLGDFFIHDYLELLS